MFQIYNPYTNYTVASDYVDLVCKCLEDAGHITEKTKVLEKDPQNEGVVVVAAKDATEAKKCGYSPVITWVQGISPEESYMRNKSIIRRTILSIFEKRGLFSSDMCIFVSEAMKEHFEKKYGFVPKHYYIMPCFNDEIEKDAFFSENKYANNTFVYAGGLQEWQCFDETARLYALVEKKCENTHFRVLTKDRETAEKIISEKGIKSFSIDCVPPEQMSDELKACKFGFALRRDNPVNNVATPTKLSNYVSRGTIPIVTDAIHDFYARAKDNEYCICVDLNDLEKSADEIARFCRKDISAEDVYAAFEKSFGNYYSRAYHRKELTAVLKDAL